MSLLRAGFTMGLIVGQPVGISAPGAPVGGGFDVMKAIQGGKEVIAGIKELIIMSKGGQAPQIPQIQETRRTGDPAPIYQQTPTQPCKAESAVREVYQLLEMLCTAGKGDLKILDLLHEKNPTIQDARDLLKKVV